MVPSSSTANEATGLRIDGSDRIVTLADGGELAARAVVLVMGVAYRRLGIETLEALTGAGVFYGAAVTEAEAMTDEHVFVVGAATPPDRPPSTWRGSHST